MALAGGQRSEARRPATSADRSAQLAAAVRRSLHNSGLLRASALRATSPASRGPNWVRFVILVVTPECAPKTGSFRQNQFGATLTGPIFKNRTFFSVGYDGWRYSQPTLALSYVPTAAEINGDFTNTPFRRRIFNPYSTRQVGNNFVRDEFRCDASGNPLPVIVRVLPSALGVVTPREIVVDSRALSRTRTH